MGEPKPRILVVEDDPLVTRMILECLRPLEVEAWAVNSGREALTEAEAAPPDLVLLDVVLPDLDGFAVTAKLKEKAATRDVPVILVTTQARMEDRVRGLEVGAADCITKPFYYEEVRARVLSALQRAAAARAAAAEAAGPTVPAAGIQGRLQEVSLPNVIQILEVERKTGTLELERGGERAALHFDEGQIVDAAWKDHGGEMAVYRILQWTEGAFRFDPAAAGAAPAQRIQSNNQHLLMEGMRRLDEGARLLGELPPPDRPLRTTPHLAAMLAKRRPAADLKQLLDLIDGRRGIGEILQALPDDLQALEALVRLKEHGFIEAP
ncbi:MAG TPA: DUF4388 domain-containing protein [Candidatus Sulfotelmatobacter sp.]|nr:DUF4388 domain-containing protein [Candidatus Sulfotelmatobacter sp.]